MCWVHEQGNQTRACSCARVPGWLLPSGFTLKAHSQGGAHSPSRATMHRLHPHALEEGLGKRGDAE